MKDLKLNLMGDLLGYLITITPVTLTYFALYLFLTKLASTKLWLVFFAPIVLIIAFTLSVLIIRLFLPKLKAGNFEANLNRDFIAWYLNMCLERAIKVSKLQELIYSLKFSKHLYWKVMGAKISYSTNSSLYVHLVDLPLISINEGSTLGDEVVINCHVFSQNKIILKPVSIGKNCLISTHSKIYYGTRIGDGAFIGMGNVLFRRKITANEKLAPMSHVHSLSKESGFS